MAMALGRAEELVGRIQRALCSRRFDLAKRAYVVLAKEHSTLPPAPTSPDAWPFVHAAVQLRVERMRLQAEQAELVKVAKARGLVMV